MIFENYYPEMEIIEIKEDFMNHVYRNGQLIGPFMQVFPSYSINWDMGYIIKPDGTIMCSRGASWWVAQYDGCKEGEISFSL